MAGQSDSGPEYAAKSCLPGMDHGADGRWGWHHGDHGANRAIEGDNVSLAGEKRVSSQTEVSSQTISID